MRTKCPYRQGRALRREVADLLDSGGVEALEEFDEEVDGLVEIAAVHDAVVGVGVADGDEEADGGGAAVAFLNFGGVVAIAGNEVVLQGELFGEGGLADEVDELAVGQLGV